MKEIINEMLEMQRHLDKVIMDAQGITYDTVSVDEYYHAILDEIGELNHEDKASWCWWKKTQAPVNREKLIEELADVWFFVLSLANKFGYQEVDFKYKRSTLNQMYLTNYILLAIKDITECNEYYIRNEKHEIRNILTIMLNLTKSYQVDIETLFKAYKKKHETNLKRVEEGY